MDDTQNSLMEYFSKLKITGDCGEEYDDQQNIQSPSKEATNVATARSPVTTTTTTTQKTPPSITKSPSNRKILKEIINSNDTDYNNRSPTKSSNNISSPEQKQQQLQLKTFEDIGDENRSPSIIIDDNNKILKENNYHQHNNKSSPITIKLPDILDNVQGIDKNNENQSVNTTKINTTITSNSTENDIKKNYLTIGNDADELMNLSQSSDDEIFVESLTSFSENNPPNLIDIQHSLESQRTTTTTLPTTSVTDTTIVFQQQSPPHTTEVVNLSESHLNLSINDEYQSLPFNINNDLFVSEEGHSGTIIENIITESTTGLSSAETTTINDSINNVEIDKNLTTTGAILSETFNNNNNNEEIDNNLTTTGAILSETFNNNNNNEAIDKNLTTGAILSETFNNNNEEIDKNLTTVAILSETINIEIDTNLTTTAILSETINTNNNNTSQLITENNNESQTKIDELIPTGDDNQHIAVLNETIQIDNNEITIGNCLDNTIVKISENRIDVDHLSKSFDQLPVNDSSAANITFDNAQQNSSIDSIENKAVKVNVTNEISTEIATEIPELNITNENRNTINTASSNSDSTIELNPISQFQNSIENSNRKDINGIPTNETTITANDETLINDLNLSNKQKELNNCNVNGSPSDDSAGLLNQQNSNPADSPIGFNKSIENNESYQSESSSNVNAESLEQQHTTEDTTILQNQLNKTLNIPNEDVQEYNLNNNGDADHNLINQTIDIQPTDRTIVVQNNDNTSFIHADTDPDCDRQSSGPKGLMNETFFAETQSSNFDSTFIQNPITNNNNLDLLNQTVNMPSKDLPIDVKTPVNITRINSIMDTELTQSQKRLSIRNDLFNNSTTSNDNSFNMNKNQLISPLKCLSQPPTATNEMNNNNNNVNQNDDQNNCGVDQTFILQNFNNDEQLNVTFKKPNLPPSNPFTMKSQQQQQQQQSSQSFTNLSRKTIDPFKATNSIGSGFPPLSSSSNVVDDSEFSTNGMIFNQSDFDVFLSKQSNATNKYEDLLIGRSSLLLNFDPLLGQQQLQQQLQKSRLPSTSEETIIQSLVDGHNSTLNNKNNNNNNNNQKQQQQQHKSKIDKLLRNSEQNLNTVAEENIEGAASLLLINSNNNNNNNSDNNTLNTETDIAGNVTMSVDIIKDMKIENDLKSFENHSLANQDKNNEYKMTDLEKKIKNEVLKSGEDFEKKLKEYEAREENLLKRISEKDKTLAKFTGVLEAYEKAIAEMVSDKEKSIQNNDSKVVELKADRDLNFQHLTSLEATFADLHVKYERSKQITMQLKENEDSLIEKEKMLTQQLKAQEQRYDQMKSHAVQQLDIANNTLETLTKNHSIELTKLKAQLKKEEISRQSVCEQLQQKSKENEELVKICDELISGQGS